ncbi:MAG: hypothetical protein M3478_09405, partial [Planctomycetota bacterium]|nr:hypothetical protein [Planctomycetota bacterium]
MNDDDENDMSAAATTTASAPPFPPRTESIRTGETNASVAMQRVPLGAELPLFCERCGYSLNALPQVICEHCAIRQFHCPECGHHQPINTLRPALQRTLGRMRAFTVGAIAFVKLNWFCWHLFFWVIMGFEWAYNWNRYTGNQEPLWPTFEAVLAFTIYGTVIGFGSRLMLLRWRSGALVGVVLGAVFCLALVMGFHWRVTGRNNGNSNAAV